MATPSAIDPILARRARVAVVVKHGKRLGSLLFAAAIALFVVGLSRNLTDGFVTAIVACLLLGSLILAPAIVVGYAVRAADREERRAALGQRGGHG